MHRLFSPYRSVFRIPGSRSLFAVALLARVPATAKGMLLTLHIVLDLHRGYGAAGLVAMALTIGVAAGGPVLGRMVDRHGVRPVLVVTGLAESVFWLTAPFLPYAALLPATLVGGLVAVPVFPVIRQAVSVHVPGGQRRQAFALDSMIVEVAYMIGPAVAVLAVTGMHHAEPSMLAVGVLTLASAAALWPLGRILTPSLPHAADAADAAPTAEAQVSSEAARTAKAGRPFWLHPGLLLTLAVCMSANLVLSGTEVSVVASLRAVGQTQWAGVTIIAWCAASLVGGFWHGTTAKPLRLPVLMLMLGLGTVPIGIVASHGWIWAALALIPAGLVCAPTIASTAEAISRAVPDSARGQAMGLQGSALTLGGSLGAPLTGSIIDHSSPVWGFVVAGLIGTVLAGLALAYRPRPAAPTADPVAVEPVAVEPVAAGPVAVDTTDGELAVTAGSH
ncbi:MFS transporter [Streptacidiphilus fuscans]|uniref:MFS transporter n=1 Tax=Streptacidiphilus fuscans TaxID=2789292 RepID=A0A931B8E1_9ACTN|nr:MFS transporter [Streptacidiphilus fuscans]MBF9069713.1 MFS transporter [Streptacidiphilus fuscans]